MRSSAADLWVPRLNSFTRARPRTSRDAINRPVNAALGAGRARQPASALYSTRMAGDLFRSLCCLRSILPGL